MVARNGIAGEYVAIDTALRKYMFLTKIRIESALPATVCLYRQLHNSVSDVEGPYCGSWIWLCLLDRASTFNIKVDSVEDTSFLLHTTLNFAVGEFRISTRAPCCTRRHFNSSRNSRTCSLSHCHITFQALRAKLASRSKDDSRIDCKIEYQVSFYSIEIQQNW